MIISDTKTCMVIVSKDEIQYEIRSSNFIAFGSPCPIPSNQILKYYKYKLLTTKNAYIKLSLLLHVQTVKALMRLTTGDAACKYKPFIDYIF